MGILEDLKRSGHTFKKGLGQNFIIDEGYLAAIVAELGLGKNDTVVEVGTGAGTLTRVLARVVGWVATYEIDKRLEPVLEKQFAGFDNIELRFEDALNHSVTPMRSIAYKLVANVPYYITTPLLTKFMNDPNCTEICVLVQEELANRIVAREGGADYGALTVGVGFWGAAQIIKRVPRTVFVPAPNVDSAFVRIMRHDGAVGGAGLLKMLFSQRRKTILNALGSALRKNREEVEALLKAANICPALRPEAISIQQYKTLFDKIQGN